MTVLGAVRSAANHRMRAYYIPLAAGALLTTSAFLPWLVLGETVIGGLPGMAGLWLLGLGLIAMLLASLSIYTRRNSRHPLLLVGLLSLGILFLAFEWLKRTAIEQAWARSEALAIVDGLAPVREPAIAAGLGIHVGVGAAIVLVLFGLTIVVKQAGKPYAEPEDDD
jgi:hypothetical protein